GAIVFRERPFAAVRKTETRIRRELILIANSRQYTRGLHESSVVTRCSLNPGILMRFFGRLILGCIAIAAVGLFPAILRAEEPAPISTKESALPLWEAVALGAIEGATEYLPVSSTGHLLIFQHWMGQTADAEETEAAHALAICIQIGAIL